MANHPNKRALNGSAAPPGQAVRWRPGPRDPGGRAEQRHAYPHEQLRMRSVTRRVWARQHPRHPWARGGALRPTRPPLLRTRCAASCTSLPLSGSSPRVLPCALLPVHRARLYGDSEAHTEYVQMIFFFLQAKLKDTRLVQGPFGERGPPQEAEVLSPARGAPGAELEGGSLPFPRPPPPPRLYLCGHRGLHTSQPASRPNRNE